MLIWVRVFLLHERRINMPVEIEILNQIQNIRTDILDILMPKISALGNAGMIWIILAAALLIIPKTRKLGVIVAIALICDLLLCNVLIKPLVARTRPFDINTSVQLLIPKPKDYSFPSGHTAASFAAAFALFFAGSRRIAIPALVLAVLIAFSRMYLYVHFPTDILGGIVVGVFCGWLGNAITKKIINNRG